MPKSRWYAIVALALVLPTAPVVAHEDGNDQLIPGGGKGKTDCMLQFFGGELNFPAPPKHPRKWRCHDGDPTCDQGPAGDGVCDFAIGACINGTGHPECTPSDVASVVVKNKPLSSPKYDPDLAALESAIETMGLPNANHNACTGSPTIVSVPLKKPGVAGEKKIKIKSASTPNPISDKIIRDNDTLTLVCDACPLDGTFPNIVQHIFQGSCATAVCHIGPVPKGKLDLEPANAHAELVDVVPDNPAAGAAGMKLVDPGHPENSFIMDKLCGADPGDPDPRPAVCHGHDLDLGPEHEGDPMPPPVGGLSEAKLNLIHAWIAGGAPATGWVPGSTCGVPPDIFEPIAPPPVPPGGFQLELPPYSLVPGQEIEGCMWVQVPITEPLDVGSFEIRMNEGSHHFIMFRFIDNGQGTTPPLNVWNPNDTACLGGGFYNEFVTGSQDPVSYDTYRDGLARTIMPGDILGLNSHYINTLNVPIEGHVYVNFHPYTGTQPHKTAKTLFAIDADFTNSGIGSGGPGIAPFTTGVTQGNWVNPETPGVCLVGVTSHMHKRGILFREEYPAGNQIYINHDWDHPAVVGFDPPLWIPNGGVLHYECTHDNGFSNPYDVKRNAAGNPAPLKFGFSADDEMCHVPGIYFVPAVAGDCSLP